MRLVVWMAWLQGVLLTALAYGQLPAPWRWVAAVWGWLLALAAWATSAGRWRSRRRDAPEVRRPSPSGAGAAALAAWLDGLRDAAGEGWVRIIRARRHADMNRLQVALGWLQMGRSERASAILSEWGRQLQWEGAALRQWPAEAAAAYYSWRTACEEAGIHVLWQRVATTGAAAGTPGGDQVPAHVVGTALAEAWEAAQRTAADQIRLSWDPAGGRLQWEVVDRARGGGDGRDGTPGVNPERFA